MKTKKEAILLVLICTFFTSIGQLFLKIGSKDLSFNFLGILTNFPLVFGFSLYIVGAVILIFALKNGELSVLYPFIATSFIWVSLLSVIFLKESMNTLKWSGVLIIIFGMAFIGKGGSLR